MKEIQQALNEMAPNLGRLIGFTDGQGEILAASEAELVGEQDPGVRAVLASGDSQVTAGDRTYRVVKWPDETYLISFSEGVDAVAKGYAELLSRWISAEQCKEDDQAERAQELKQIFLKNVLFENELPGDIPLKAREFRIRYNERRVVMLVHFKSEEFKACLEVLTELAGDRAGDFILPMDEENIVLMTDATEERLEGLDDFLLTLTGTLQERAMADVAVGVGMVAPTLTETAKSYQQASIALIVGRIFQDAESPIMRYEKLGLGRLIYQLPITLCELFLREVFEPGTYEALDPVTRETIDKFFENSLNGSETSRQLFVHRNTLVYRLDKVQKITGLDLRNFEDAVLFKLADMVRNYLAYVEEEKKKR
ncbi:MAG TPA: helix-turn-helix domain-containing protein [Bacillota bacterium]|jgi:carbohydrate diacid regulator|nr:PucR family transcriptional regulator [Fastidiosipila sp.]HPX93305.1 helix-turn-helix domain-containing protein [Bacillota bacterium]HQB80964.1 helix-turn-helix domain-containing protein [Bacillota bacterium]